MVKYLRAEGVKEFADDRKPGLFIIIIVVCFADALYYVMPNYNS